MIEFLIKSTLCLGIFLAFYHLVLEREKMHQFNRFYLLLSIVVSLIIPFVTFEIIKIIPVVQDFEVINGNAISKSTENVIFHKNKIEVNKATNYIAYIIWGFYVIVALILSIQFGKNISKLISKAKSNPIIRYKKAKLVLVDENILPHSFLNYIFICSEEYSKNGIEDELYTHELVHVTQKHTLDILFVELLKVIFWFNPIYIFYKKAIQLNHEFLADEEIVKTYNNVPFYQNLLLQKGDGNQTIYLASNLNYLVTKKRFIMMTKNTSQKISIMKKIAILPIVAILFYFLSVDIIAQEKIIPVKSELSNAPKTIVDIDYNRLTFDSFDNVMIEGINSNTTKDNFEPQNREKKIIVIDAGHGGKDHGAENNDELESKIVESIAKKIKLLNVKDNVEIILLREDDSFIGLNERVDKINEINPALLISLHVNASKNSNENGVNAYVSSQNEFYEKSLEAANKLIDKISNSYLAKGEVSNANLFVIKNSKCPAVILEVGYLSNENDKAYITSEKGKNEIADRVYEFVKQE